MIRRLVFDYTNDMADPDFKTGTEENDEAFKGFDCILCCLRYLFLCWFLQILCFGRRNKMVETAEQIQYYGMSLCMNFGIDMINQIKLENPHLWTPEFQVEARNMIHETQRVQICC